ncbi:MAG: hypothetical protein RTU30_02975, partial [Candidatus Thorarchaeota archaeon]
MMARGRKKRGFRANVVLASAIFTGLSSLVRLAERRANHRTNSFNRSIEKIWKEACHRRGSTQKHNPRDFSDIQNVESNLRQLFLKMVWYSTKSYGNKEVKRVYDWRDGTVGPLNALLNFTGSVLRELSVTRYPFPTPRFFQIREYHDGSQKILVQRVAESSPDNSVKKSYWRA